MQNKLHPEELELKGVYKIVNLITGEYYVGSTTTTFYKRYMEHLNILSRLRKHHCKPLMLATNKYLLENFEFKIFFVDTDDNWIRQVEHYEIKNGATYNIQGNNKTADIIHKMSSKNRKLNHRFAAQIRRSLSIRRGKADYITLAMFNDDGTTKKDR